MGVTVIPTEDHCADGISQSTEEACLPVRLRRLRDRCVGVILAVELPHILPHGSGGEPDQAACWADHLAEVTPISI